VRLYFWFNIALMTLLLQVNPVPDTIWYRPWFHTLSALSVVLLRVGFF
jgi:hypothetical protein